MQPETLFGRTLELDVQMAEGTIRMHPETWKQIRPTYRCNEVVTIKEEIN